MPLSKNLNATLIGNRAFKEYYDEGRAIVMPEQIIAYTLEKSDA